MRIAKRRGYIEWMTKNIAILGPRYPFISAKAFLHLVRMENGDIAMRRAKLRFPKYLRLRGL